MLLYYFTAFVILIGAVGVIAATKPVHSCLSFLLTLLGLATLYIEMHATFIGVMQIIVYGGAIMVTFMFVMVLFQDAHAQIDKNAPRTSSLLTYVSIGSVLMSLTLAGYQLVGLTSEAVSSEAQFGSTEQIGRALYTVWAFPFEAMVVVFLVALVGSLYIGKKV